MAYDNNGNYYFDPRTDGDDAEILDQAKRLKQATDYAQAEENMVRQQKEAQQILNEELSEAGIDQATYQRLVAEDEDTAREAYRESVRNIIQRVKRPRNKKGQFVPHTRETAHHAHHRSPDRQARFEDLKAKAQNRPLTSSEEEEIVDDIIGDALL